MPLTVKLRNGMTVAAKLYEGEPTAITYANRTQANKACDRLNQEGDGRWEVRRGIGRPFFVALWIITEHWHPAFIDRMTRIAEHNGLTLEDMIPIWEAYKTACHNGDQSCLVSECLQWNAAALPNGEPEHSDELFMAALS